MTYWWASQGKNHEMAIRQGTLWSLPRRDGTLAGDRVILKAMKLGDVVFHCKGPFLRAASEVTEEWRDARRPEGYPRKDGEGMEGWLVRVNPLATELRIHRDRVAELIQHGEPGPLDRHGGPRQKYMSRLSDDEGEILLAESGVDAPPMSARDAGVLGLPSHRWTAEETDSPGIRLIRLEQGDLRKHLLQSRRTAPCSICGVELPVHLLIAGHIKPRSLSTEGEPKDFNRAAMLICALGCDALFEWGYIVVDDEGIVRRGRTAETKNLEESVDSLIGKECIAFNQSTASNFAEHALLVLG